MNKTPAICGKNIILRKSGFKKDGILRENALIDGEYHSDIIMSILDYEFNSNIMK